MTLTTPYLVNQTIQAGTCTPCFLVNQGQGKPGTGKTQVLLAIIRHSIKVRQQVLLACPTGYLASKYRYIFGNQITTNTIHGAFHIPVNREDRTTINFGVSFFDIVVIDEVSMLSPRRFQKIATTMNQLPTRPVLILGGDKSQQPPLETVNRTVRQVPSILHDNSLTG